MQANPGKKLEIKINDQEYLRLPVKTRLATPETKDYAGFVAEHLENLTKPDDIIFVSEKLISIMQGRSYHIDDIRPSWLATKLSAHVFRNPGGIGLAMPQTMQLAIEEVGIPRILLAAAIAALTKPLGIKGLFYRVAGRQAAAIDGPVPYAIPPYNHYASKGPSQPEKAARAIFERLGEHPKAVAIVDANDFGVEVLGLWPKRIVPVKFLKKALADNPLGQTNESTPIGIIRK